MTRSRKTSPSLRNRTAASLVEFSLGLIPIFYFGLRDAAIFRTLLLIIAWSLFYLVVLSRPLDRIHKRLWPR